MSHVKAERVRSREVQRMEDSENTQDAELVAATRAGDREAFGRLVERHGARIHALCYRLSGRAAVAPELAHDSFVDAYLKLDQLRDPARFSGWLRRIALNVCRMWLRKRPDLRFDEEIGADVLHDPRLAAEPGAEELANLASGIGRLRTPHRVILALRYLEGLAYEEIATFLDLPLGTVMSRLHRARHALRTEILADQPDEEPALMTTEQLKRDIENEIAVLLDAFSDGKSKGPVERLRVLLKDSPERFALLLQTVERGNLERLAVLLPRLGARSIELTVALALGAEPEAAVRARSVLKALLERSPASWRGGYSAMPAREAYHLVDQVFRREAPASTVAQLFFELLERTPAGATGTLILQAFLCQPREAYALLVERYNASTDPAELNKQPYLLYGLCRYGAQFCQHVLAELARGPSERDSVSFAAVEALSMCLKTPPRAGDAGLEDLRSAEKYPPLSAADVGGPELRGQLIELAALRCDDPRSPIQEAALRVLANLGARDKQACVRALLQSARISTRCQALYTLAELGISEASDEILAAAESGNVAEQVAALAVIARLKLHGALEVLRRLLEDDERSVRDAALAALGELGSPEADALLHDLLRSDDPEQARLAAEVIFSAQPSMPPWKGSALTRQRLARIRGDAQPFCRDSLGATIRFGTRELRRYEEKELTRAIARVCSDFSAARRHLIEQGLMTREEGTYEFTSFGATIWRVEHRVVEGQPTFVARQ